MFGIRNFVSRRLDRTLPPYCGAEEKSPPPSPAPTSITHPDNPLNPLLPPTSGSSLEDEDYSFPHCRSESFYTRPSPEKKSAESNPAESDKKIAAEPTRSWANSYRDSEEEEAMINLKPYAPSASPLKGILVKRSAIQAPKKQSVKKVTFSIPLGAGEADAGDESEPPFTSDSSDDKKPETYDLSPQLSSCQVKSIEVEILGSIEPAQPQTYFERSYD